MIFKVFLFSVVLHYAKTESPLERDCASLQFSSVYKWDMCFSMEEWSTYNALADSCSQLPNGRPTTGLSTSELSELLGSIYDSDSAGSKTRAFSMRDGHQFQTGDKQIKLDGRFPTDIERFQIDFKYYSQADSEMKIPLSLIFEFAGAGRPVDSLTCSSLRLDGAGDAEELRNAGVVGKTDFTIEIAVQAATYEISMDSSFFLSCARAFPISDVSLIAIWGYYEGNGTTVVESLTRDGYLYGGEAFVWMNLVRDSVGWQWKSGGNKIAARDTDVLWAAGQPDNANECAVINAQTHELSSIYCTSKAYALCMYEANYKKFSFAKTVDKMGDPLSLVGSRERISGVGNCLAGCNAFSLCRGVDYNSNTKTCNLYNSNNKTDSSGYEFFEKI